MSARTEAGDGQDTEDSAGQCQNHNESSEPPPKKKKLGSWLKAARKEQESCSTRSPEKLMKDEIEQYSKIIKPDADSNPLDWWKIHESAYSTLAKLAKKYLCICASVHLAVHLNGCLAHLDMLHLRRELCLSPIN